MASSLLAAGLTPFTPTSAPPLPKLEAAPVLDALGDTDEEADDLVKKGSNVDRLYEEAEAVRLKTPPFTPPSVPPLPKLEVAPVLDALGDTDEEADDLVKKESNVNHLYEEAEAIRLKTPPATARHSSVTEDLPMKSSLMDKQVKSWKAPVVTESLLFQGLYVDAKAGTRPKSGLRSYLRARAEKTQKPTCSGCVTPTTASRTHLASSVEVGERMEYDA